MVCVQAEMFGNVGVMCQVIHIHVYYSPRL